MRSSNRIERAVWAIAAGGVLLTASLAHAQVNSESLNPNPMLPSGVGSPSDIEEYHHGSSSGAKMGRMPGGADKNPADIMLRDIGGTNRGRRTGRAVIRGGAVRAALRVEGPGRASPLGQEGSVYFARRGDYENAIYAPYRGTYREPAPRRRPATRTSSQR